MKYHSRTASYKVHQNTQLVMFCVYIINFIPMETSFDLEYLYYRQLGMEHSVLIREVSSF